MKKNETTLRCIVTRRTRDQLRAAEAKAVEVRKWLKKIQPKVAKGGGDMDGAVQLVKTIERLAHFGQTCPADVAVDVVSHVEVLSSILRAEVDSFLAS